ncbi:hypothetical protein C8R43DRAFT_1244179 [Mycena crocata]|nr:hypothetical protein C8R43DRAFT_1244179 [Mycena crocata]
MPALWKRNPPSQYYGGVPVVITAAPATVAAQQHSLIADTRNIALCHTSTMSSYAEPPAQYVPHSYGVQIRTLEELNTHLGLLKEFAASCGEEANGVEFSLGNVVEVITCYFAKLSPKVLEWVKARPEVVLVEQEKYLSLA